MSLIICFRSVTIPILPIVLQLAADKRSNKIRAKARETLNKTNAIRTKSEKLIKKPSVKGGKPGRPKKPISTSAVAVVVESSEIMDAIPNRLDEPEPEPDEEVNHHY